MRIHFIAIGGSAMHNLALALHQKGNEVTGSDDLLFEPSKSRLENAGIAPKELGWNPEIMSEDIDAVILGMHAKPNNPELKRAQELGLKIYSYPEFLFHHAQEKIRVVIGGSHGKTTITSMVMHVLNYLDRNFDYMVGAQLEGFETMVKLTNDAPIMIFEGDEYLSSPIDLTSKFLWYKPHLALLSGIAWDHINVFPTFDYYVEQFVKFTESIPDKGALVYCSLDPELNKIAEKEKKRIKTIPYATPEHMIKNGVTSLKMENGEFMPIQIFGAHNLQNLNGARHICNELNISNEQFYEAIQSFKGASKRLELLGKNNKTVVLKDFAHSPSKLKATTNAVKAQYPERKLVAVLELHTYSSLNKEFLKEYKDTMNGASTAIVYYDPKIIENKGLEEISIQDIKDNFNNQDILVRTDAESLEHYLKGLNWDDANLLLMSSGNFGGIDQQELANGITK